MTVSLTTLAVSFTLIIVTAAAYDHSVRIRRMRGSKPPPGPLGLPLLGNMFDFPTGDVWYAYQAMSQKYESTIIQLSALGTTVVVLHDLQSARDLMEKRSSLYSDRMGSNNIVFLPYGDLWRASRRVIHQEFKPLATQQYNPSQTKATRDLLHRLLESPDRWLEHLKHLTAGLTLDIIYGIDIAPSNDPYIAIVETAVEGNTSAAKPGAFLVDTIPWLKYVPSWVPGADFQVKAKIWKEATCRAVDDTYNTCKKALAEGSNRSSFCSRHLARLSSSRDNNIEEFIIKESATAVYVEIQAKAQAEIDHVTGQGRLPVFGEESSFPYLMAILKECLRWRVVGPIGIPHRLIADDHYNGYFLPAGSIIIANSWAILHDENTYPDPDSFKPERFMKDEKLDLNVQDPALAAFGYGRRNCPGREMALDTVWITLASILSAFNISKALDGNGLPITPSGRYISSIVSHVEPFQCAITPRSDLMKDLILATAD
ncbi:hypothetical protein HWV62_9741 [Athelia sp. TMB]|nr:hypothetical protein HWV62_9741 [Athelia sp. TMB]